MVLEKVINAMLRPVFLAFVMATACATAPATGATERSDGSLDIALPNLDGSMTDVAAPGPQGVVVLVFWATWCQPCQQELIKMNGLYADHKERGLALYAVNIDGPDTQAQVGPWVQREGYGFPILMDRETRLLTRYNPRGDIPYYVVLDSSGKVLKGHQGYTMGDGDELAAYLESVLPPAS
ncbi:MAG: TlpA family protein disulfide reductase [bacterium]|nr:TlpA family protein disulfide reductase [bacterium]